MKTGFNELTFAESERLALLLEELGEAQQAIGKILRHGYSSYHPKYPGGPNNRESLQRELGDVLAAMDLMDGHGDINLVAVRVNQTTKTKKLRAGTYLHHQQ